MTSPLDQGPVDECASRSDDLEISEGDDFHWALKPLPLHAKDIASSA